MKVSYRWLQDFVEIRETAQQLGDRFTNAGLAVESLESIADDAIFELDVPTNRSDCLSHLGVAREVATIYENELKPPQFHLRETEHSSGQDFSISILDPDLCARYCG